MMRLIMMEAGPQVIVVNADSGHYFIVNASIWQRFHNDAFDPTEWRQGCEFLLPKAGERFSDNSAEPTVKKTMGDDVTSEELIARFISQELNSGAMIAKRDAEQGIAVLDKRRYKKLCEHYG